jgi:hypothetical protein
MSSSKLHAQTMVGGPYTLNGSVSVITNQSQGGPYSLQSSSFAVPMSISTSSNNQVSGLTAESRLFSGSGTQDMRFLYTTSTPVIFIPDTIPKDVYTDSLDDTPFNNTVGEKRYVEPTSVGTFGRKDPTSSSTPYDQSSTTTHNITFLIIGLGLCFLGIRTWVRFHKNSK